MVQTHRNTFRTDDELIVDALKKAYDREAPPSRRLDQLVAALRKSQRASEDA